MMTRWYKIGAFPWSGDAALDFVIYPGPPLRPRLRFNNKIIGHVNVKVGDGPGLHSDRD
jgi:hypothetical protein